jgi:predicted nucleic acid-binding protein
MVVVDSSVWIDAFNGVDNAETRWLRGAISRGEVALNTLILCEVLRGFRSNKGLEHAQHFLSLIPVFDQISAALAMQTAANFRLLRARGITIRKTIDCLIATFCIHEGHELLHRDRDFDAFEQHLGLQVIKP